MWVYTDRRLSLGDFGFLWNKLSGTKYLLHISKDVILSFDILWTEDFFRVLVMKNVLKDNISCRSSKLKNQSKCFP